MESHFNRFFFFVNVSTLTLPRQGFHLLQQRWVRLYEEHCKQNRVTFNLWPALWQVGPNMTVGVHRKVHITHGPKVSKFLKQPHLKNIAGESDFFNLVHIHRNRKQKQNFLLIFVVFFLSFLSLFFNSAFAQCEQTLRVKRRIQRVARDTRLSLFYFHAVFGKKCY